MNIKDMSKLEAVMELAILKSLMEKLIGLIEKSTDDSLKKDVMHLLLSVKKLKEASQSSYLQQ